MIACIIIVSLALIWLGYESKWLTVRLTGHQETKIYREPYPDYDTEEPEPDIDLDWLDNKTWMMITL